MNIIDKSTYERLKAKKRKTAVEKAQITMYEESIKDSQLVVVHDVLLDNLHNVAINLIEGLNNAQVTRVIKSIERCCATVIKRKCGDWLGGGEE